MQISRLSTSGGSNTPPDPVVIVNWSGSTGPYQVESHDTLLGNWQEIGGVTYASAQTNVLTKPGAFYRVASVAAAMAASPDKVPPTVPAGLALSFVTSNQVNLSWNASIDGGSPPSGLKGYNVYRNGIFLQQILSPGTSASDTGLKPLSTYSYSVSAVDNAYNESARSPAIIVSTPATGNCSFALSLAAVSSSAAGLSTNLNVSAPSGCSWVVNSNVSWISITAGTSGTGNGAVDFTILPNTSTSQRSAAVTIADQTLTVSQAASSGPSVSLTAPSAGSTVSGNASITASASDSLSISQVQFYCDNTVLVGTATTAPYSVSWNTTTAANGSHTLSAKAVDSAGNSTTSSSISVTVNNSSVTPTGTCIWEQHFGGTRINVDGATVASVKEDHSGDVVAAGSFQGTVNFGGGSVASAGTQNIFLIKYDGSGNYLWSRQFGSTGSDQASALAIDSNNNIVVVGTFVGTVDFGGTVLSSAGSSDIFVAKYGPTGALLWAKRFGGSATERCYAVALDSANNILLTGGYGFYGSAVDFGGGPLPLSGGLSAFLYDVFVAKLDPSGNYLWAHGYGGSGYTLGNAITVDASGNVLVVGSFQQSVSFGGPVLSSAGGYDVFVAKYSAANGSYLWSASGGGSGDDLGNAVAVDSSGNVVVSGSFSGTANFGTTALSSMYNAGMLLAKYSANGANLWARGFSGLTSYAQASGNGVAIDGVGNIVVSGSVCGAVGFDGLYLGNGSADILLAKFSPSNGGTIWAKSYGGLMNNYGLAISIGANNNILSSGSFAQTADFGCGAMSSACEDDGFVVKLTP